MDEIAYEKSAYDKICEKVENILVSLGYKNSPMIPVSTEK